jgi:hypothetical protein
MEAQSGTFILFVEEKQGALNAWAVEYFLP